MKALQTIQAVALSCLLSIGAASCGSEEAEFNLQMQQNSD